MGEDGGSLGMLPFAAPMSPLDFNCSRSRGASRNCKRERAAAEDRAPNCLRRLARPLHRAEGLHTRKGRATLAP